jgi:hypothetical protein
MEPSAGDHGQSNQLADDGTKAAVRQGFLHGGQNVFLLVTLDEDDAASLQARLRECREKQVGSRQTPDDLALRPGGDTCSKQGCGRSIDRTRPASGKLVDRSVSKTASRQSRIDLGDAERQAACALYAATFKRGDAVS